MRKNLYQIIFLAALTSIFIMGDHYSYKSNKTLRERPKTRGKEKINKHRKPAALVKKTSPSFNTKKKGPFFPRKKMNEFKGLKTINTPSPKWKDHLKSGIFRFGFTAENFKINHIESVARKEGKKVRNLEWVKISYTQKGFPQMYDALVDSASGRVIQTWNHVKYEPMFNRHRKLKFNLTGLLKKSDD